MAFDRKQYLREYQKKWYREIVASRRKKWFEENGPCHQCGSWENLELDHIDRTTKVHHVIWTWSEQRREDELKKCQPLCHDCHKKKSVAECFDSGVYGANKKRIVDGKAWCGKCCSWLDTDNFNRDMHTATGLYGVCKDCRRKYPSRKKLSSRSLPDEALGYEPRGETR